MQQARRVLMLMGALSMGLPAISGAQTFAAGVKAGLAVTGMPNAGEVVNQVVNSAAGTTTFATAESTSRVGLSFGGYVRFPITERVGFEPEALFTMKGVKLDQAGGGGGTVSVRINYLDVPLLVRYETSPNNGRRLYAMAGPSFGIKLSQSGQLDGSGSTLDLDLDSGLKSLDLGLAFGGGVEYERYLIEGRFVAGVTDVASTTYDHADSLRNRTFLVLFGFKIR